VLGKKENEEKNIAIVRDFKKTFFNLNHREAIETEIFSNLTEVMEKETIKRVLEVIDYQDSQQPIVKAGDSLV
jgi:hypothetical protein